LRKFSTPTFNYYSVVHDLVQHIRHFRDKMIINSHNNLIICLTFLSILKVITSDWFYSLPQRSLHNFEEVTKASLTQYASRWVVNRRDHHILFIMIRQSDNFKSYIDFFQKQLAKIPNTMRKSLHSHSSAGYKSPTPCTNTF